MPLNKIKHTISEIDGVRCSVVETGASQERVAFLKALLEHNKFEVKVAEEKKEGEPLPSLSVLPIFFLILFFQFTSAPSKALMGLK